MTGFIEQDGVLCADGVPLTRIAAEVGTPAYVYSSHIITDQFLKLQNAMRVIPAGKQQPLLCFAAKANSNIAVLNLLQKLGSGLEIVSEGELRRGLAAGFDPKKIVATGVGKSREEITAYLNAGILQFNIESLPEIAQINTVAKSLGKVADVVFRLNPNVGGGGHAKITTGLKGNKFGIPEEQVYEAFGMAKDMAHINAIGLSMHIGSQVFEVQKFQEAFGHIPQIVSKLRDAGHTVTRLDIGGGFPIVYKDEQLLDLDSYARWVNDIIVPLGTEIIMEPGRYLVGNAGVLLTKVLLEKDGEHNFLVVDAGMNDLIRPAMYDAWHGIEPVVQRNAARKDYDVVGPVCESSDTFTPAGKRDLPRVSEGDLVVLREAGAYGASMGSNYNTRLLPPEILVKDGKYHVIRPRQTYDEIIGRESIPSF